MIDRYLGCLLGLAAGDAVGTTVEFSPPGTFVPVTDMAGGGPFSLEPGQWTDDTSMALCLAESLIACPDFDPADQMRRYVRWRNDGHLSSNGRCFDIGVTVRGALGNFIRTGEPYSGPTDEYSAGNGSIMRLAPVAMRYASDPATAIERAADSSRTTHGALEAIDGCRYMAGILVGLLRGASKAEVLEPGYAPIAGAWDERPLAPRIAEVAAGSFKRREPPEIEGTGYVVRSLEAALWAFHRTGNFRDGCLLAVNLGHDADTTAAIYGQFAGACYGVGSIPPQWRSQLALESQISSFARQLYSLAWDQAHQGTTDEQ
jgi:ADP-ribosyl-[dinitrogen reductase] hydrolase